MSERNGEERTRREREIGMNREIGEFIPADRRPKAAPRTTVSNNAGTLINIAHNNDVPIAFRLASLLLRVGTDQYGG